MVPDSLLNRGKKKSPGHTLMTGGVKSDLLFGLFSESVFLAGFLVPTDEVVLGKTGIHLLYGARLRDFRIDFLLALDIAHERFQRIVSASIRIQVHGFRKFRPASRHEIRVTEQRMMDEPEPLCFQKILTVRHNQNFFLFQMLYFIRVHKVAFTITFAE